MGFQLGDNEPGKSTSFFGSQGSFTEINVTPFVDVVLVLLIIFMVATPLAISGVNVQLPSTKAKTLHVKDNPLVLSVTESGDFYLGKALIPSPALVEKLKAAKGSDNEAQIYIRADRKVPYGKVMEAMAASQLAGIQKIGMLGEAASSGKK
jgi:biopolymer transport protein TolR